MRLGGLYRALAVRWLRACGWGVKRTSLLVVLPYCTVQSGGVAMSVVSAELNAVE